MFTHFNVLWAPPEQGQHANLARAIGVYPTPKQLLHPPTGLPILSLGDQDGCIMIQDPLSLSSFTKKNILYLASQPAADSFRINEYGLDATYLNIERVDVASDVIQRLRRITNKEHSPIHGHLFQELDHPRDGSKLVYLRIGPGKGSILNPLLMRLERSGRQLHPTDGPDLIKLLRGPAGNPMLACEPEYLPECAARIAIRHRLADKLRRRDGPHSVFDRLLFGNRFPSSGLDTGQAGLGLDSLGGRFLAVGAGTDQFQVTWTDSCRLSPNERWLSDVWLKDWGGTVPASPNPKGVFRQIPPEPTVGPADATTLVASAAALPDMLRSASGLLKLLPGPRSAPLKMVSDVLSSLPDDDEAQDCHHGSFEYYPSQQRLTVDTVAIVDRFVRKYLLPQSSVYIPFPNTYRVIRGTHPDADAATALAEACKGLVLNPAVAPRLPGWSFLTRYLAAFASPLSPNPIEIPLQFGWWSDWYDRLFDTAAGTRFDFRASLTGAIADVARLDEALVAPTYPDYSPDHPIYL